MGTGPHARRARPRLRMTVGRLLLVAILAAAGLKLVSVQVFRAGSLSTQAEAQRLTRVNIPAERGTISGRYGTKLAFSVKVDALSVQPKRMRAQWNEAVAQGAEQQSYQAHIQRLAGYLKQRLGDAIDEPDLLRKLRSDRSFLYLGQTVDPSVAEDIAKRFPMVAVEHRALRKYPNGKLAANVIGMANWRKDRTPAGIHGLIGLESAMDRKLAGTSGQRIVDTEQGNNNVVIPGTERDVKKARPGESVALTLDADLQYQLHRMLVHYKKRNGAKHGSAVVLDAHTGQVYALTNDTAFDPNDPAHLDPKQIGDAAVTTPFEPGSVNKIVVTSAAVAGGIAGPMTHINVPSQLPVADTVIHDDWTHPDQTYTVTGVVAKSSNIGADLLARKVGPRRWMDMARKLGIGQCTGIGLPGETCGYLPPRHTWSGTTFANLPIGQGLSMNILQLTGMYQAIANHGVRVPPRIIKSTTGPDGTVVAAPRPAGVRVMSPQKADTVKEIFSHVTQDQPSPQRGTATSAALPGYNIAGKTGTAQKVVNGHYSDSKTTTTFVGILPAKNPRFVVGIMLDAPRAGSEAARTAAPLFHDVAAYLAQRYHIPTSRRPTQNVPFVL